jgi:hypothetical protein
MLRLRSALQEWLQLRARVREEHRFHLDRSAADFRCVGFSPRAAKHKARVRFGSRRNLRIARRELGGDLPGLAHLLRVHRVLASAWLQPIVLLATIVLILLVSPEPRGVLDAVLGKSPKREDRGVEFLSAHGRYPWGLAPSEFDALQSMATVTEVEPYRGRYARARARQGVTLEAIQSEARAKTGHQRFWVEALPDRMEIAIGPARVVWWLIALYAVYFLRASGTQFRVRWLVYGFAVTGLHALASLIAWAFANQLWNRTIWSTAGTGAFGFSLLMGVLVGIAAIQCRYAWGDLRRRCPACLDCLVLPLTEGTADSVLFNPVVTESVCAHGHGVLVESRWSRTFRAQESPLQGLIGA